jgi:hypothetical protein
MLKVDCQSHMCGIGQLIKHILESSFWVQLLVSTYVNSGINNYMHDHHQRFKTLQCMFIFKVKTYGKFSI